MSQWIFLVVLLVANTALADEKIFCSNAKATVKYEYWRMSPARPGAKGFESKTWIIDGRVGGLQGNVTYIFENKVLPLSDIGRPEVYAVRAVENNPNTDRRPLETTLICERKMLPPPPSR